MGTQGGGGDRRQMWVNVSESAESVSESFHLWKKLVHHEIPVKLVE